MKTTAFITWALLASCLAFGVGSAASWLLGRPASASGDGSGVSDPLLPDLVAVTLEAAPEGESEATRVIFVGKHEVTIAGWEQCVDAGACDHRPRQRRYQGADHPVTGVNWLDVQQYVRWLSELTGQRLRLPRASEWDFLAQDVVEQEVKKLWDDPRLAWAADYANYGLRGSKATKPVGHFSENRQGIFDLDGNVWEWTDTCWLNNDGKSSSEATENCGGSRVLAGTHKTYQSEFVRQVPVGGCSIGVPPANIGFRLVLDDEPKGGGQGALRTLRETLRLAFT